MDDVEVAAAVEVGDSNARRGAFTDDAGPDEGSGARPGPPGGRPRGAVTGGWGFDAPDNDASSAPAHRPFAESPQPAQEVKRGHFDDDNELVPTIPDLEEEAEEDITRQVAAPPAAAPTIMAPVRSVRELDVALAGKASQLPATPEEGVDLAPLMQCLCSEKLVFEKDETWDHELIFQEVASAMNSDAAKDEEGETEEDNKIGNTNTGT
mmetsp:Transcript_117485/g.314989  ORF Transcript_117485/g.314989 Transcript_117485/m.314989 type:complete len:209 (+) Transcript_117485:84-710(+)